MQDTFHSSPVRRDVAVDSNKDPEDSLSRPLNTEESWACYRFEVHARKCVYCHNSFEVHRIHEQLCEVGHTLAQSVARCLYRESDGSTYSTVEEDNELVRIEIPTGYVEVCSLLKAIERSIRHRCLMPFVSMDLSYFTVPKKSHPSPEESSADQVELDSSNLSADEISTSSIPPLASSAKNVSKGSGSSVVKIAAATRVLLSILRDDEVLRPLYTTAIHGAIGPQTFVNAFRRLLIEFARRLKDEAQDRWGYLAARLVVWMAKDISNEVLERYQSRNARELDAAEEREGPESKWDATCSSDEDEREETNMDEDSLEKLTNMCQFLITSASFKLLQTDMKTLASSKDQSKESSSEMENEMDSEEGTNRSNIPLKPSLQTDTHAGPTESIILANHRGMLEEDSWVLDIYLYARARLGKDRFIIAYSELLRHHHSNAHAPPDSEVDRSIGGSINEQVMITWQRIASAITWYLEDVDTISSYKSNEKCGANAGKRILLDPLSSGVKYGRDPAPYHHLNSDIALLALRGPLRQLFSHIPKGAIDLSARNDTSFVNRTKAFLEDYTMVEWDWWPLTSRVPDVAHNERRLQWKFGGDQLYEILSSEEFYIIRYAMSSLPDHPKQCFCCHIERPGKITSPTAPQSLDNIATPWIGQRRWSLPVTWIKAAIGRASKPSNSSKAGQRYTPTTSSTTSTPVTSPPVAGGTSTSPAAMNNSNSAPQISGQPSTVPPIAPPIPSLRVLFGVQGSRWSLEIEQITITAVLNDPAFFRELKTRYKKHRSWIKQLMSPFRFRFCRFVKLEKFDAGRVLSQGDGLPEHPKFEDDYDYAPKPGTIPMITPKTFAVCLKACDMNCKWPWLNPWHDCVSLPCRSYRLGCIPKKKSEFDIQSNDAIAVAWGLEADHAISFAFMAVYHLVPLLAAFGFWIYWLIKFPGDWQNAAVPVLTVLAIFAVLWVPFGKHLGIV